MEREQLKFKVKHIVNIILIALYMSLRKVYRVIRNYLPLIVFIVGLALINLGIYMFMPILCLITTGATLVVLALMYDRDYERINSIKMDMMEKRIENDEKGS